MRNWKPLAAIALVLAVFGGLAAVRWDGEGGAPATEVLGLASTAPIVGESLVGQPGTVPVPTSQAVDQVPADGLVAPLGSPVVVDGDAAVYDLRLAGGERFRLSVPTALAVDMTMQQRPPPAPVVIQGPDITIEIVFDHCERQDSMAMNPFGSLVVMADGVVRFCRPDELLVIEVSGATGLSPADAAAFDLRPIELGSRYGEVLDRIWPEFSNCGNCAPWGPMAYETVVVNRTGDTSVTVVRRDTLAVAWSRDLGGYGTYLHGGPGGVYVEATGGPFLRLDPITGTTQWTIERDEDERAAHFSGHGEGIWLLGSSFQIEGDDRAPLLRRIEIDTGAVLWTASGRGGAEWQWTRPIVIDGVAVMMDVTNNPQVPVGPSGGTLRAYDAETGRPVWTTDLASPTEAYDHGLLEVFETSDGPVLVALTIDGTIVRVDPADGAVVWRASIPAGGYASFGGTDFAQDGSLAIDVVTSEGRILLDPTTGGQVP